MKTPREFLLNKHAAAEPKLDAIAREVLRANEADQPEPRSWLDWLFPSPVAWGAIAGTWVLIIGFHIAAAQSQPGRHVTVAKRSPETLQALREQRKLFVELVRPTTTDAEPTRLAPRPRSERTQSTAMA